ncbi:hypothetical protein SEA_FRANSOYER_49 [Microbacterium phage Fransoyer]|nr:hypothetical protein SEA_RUBYRALPH_49 [Microbacterium phage RubyRalph]QUE25598.1 hypothetical protein SEA_SADLAD_51 [Microbacterium phage SadLad]UUG69614.1 hypothetical protein SEA_FRANSOYER_49 [Microbacterium phage Fransoyer]
MIEHIRADGEPTPTVRELYERRDGSAEATAWSNDKVPVPTKFRLTDKGHAEIGRIMRANATETLRRGTGRLEGVMAVIRGSENLTPEQVKNREEKRSGSKSAWTPS